MGNKSKLIGTFALGALAGIALIKLIQSDEGHDFIANAKQKAKTAADEIKKKINQLEIELAEILEQQTENDLNNNG